MLRPAVTKKEDRTRNECHRVHDDTLVRDPISMASFKHLGKIYHTSCTFEGGEQVSDTMPVGFRTTSYTRFRQSSTRVRLCVCRER